MRTPTSRVGNLPCPVACPKLYFVPHKRTFLRRSATRLGWTPLKASQATGSHPLGTPPKAAKGRMGTFNPCRRQTWPGLLHTFFFFTTKCYQRVGWFHPSPAKRRCRCHCGLEISGTRTRPGMCACDCDLTDADGVPSTKTRASTHELAMLLFSFPRILRFERHVVIRPLLRASSQVQLQHLPAG